MKKGLVLLIYCKTAMQVADIFTKQLFPKHFERLRRVLMGHENWDDMVQRVVESVTQSGDNIDDPNLCGETLRSSGITQMMPEGISRTNLLPTQVVYVQN